MKQRVVFTANDRPHYMHETLESWSKVRGVSGALLDFHCEPGHPAVVEECRQAASFAEVHITVNPERYGVLRNPYEALDSAFRAGDKYVILAEDDMVVSDDILELHGWCRRQYANDGLVIANCMSQGPDFRKLGHSAVVRVAGFGWLWGTWDDRWAKLGPEWDMTYWDGGWDHHIAKEFIQKRGYRVIAPALTRVEHIGREGGTHCKPEDFDRLQAPFFEAQVSPQEYQEGVLRITDIG